MADSEMEKATTFSQQVREKLIWFIFAILLAFGTTWVQTRLNVNTVQNKQAMAAEEINELQRKQDKIDRARERIKLRIRTISQKIDLLLQSEGLYERYRNEYRSQYPQQDPTPNDDN